jgi:hypothetical protein
MTDAKFEIGEQFVCKPLFVNNKQWRGVVQTVTSRKWMPHPNKPKYSYWRYTTDAGLSLPEERMQKLNRRATDAS